MITTSDRRKQPGVPIVTSRPALMKLRCGDAGLLSRPLPVQPGPAWPEHRPPVVLDTIGLAVQQLVALLANPPQASSMSILQLANGQCTKAYAPIITLADAQNRQILRLLSLSPAVRLVCPDDPVMLRRWLPYVASARPVSACAPPAIWLVDTPPDLQLDPLLLPALAALPLSASIRMVAERCGVSESTMSRMLRMTKTVLGMPPGDVSRFRPEELAAAILERLSTL